MQAEIRLIKKGGYPATPSHMSRQLPPYMEGILISALWNTQKASMLKHLKLDPNAPEAVRRVSRDLNGVRLLRGQAQSPR
jgi:hypothetical protein